MFCWKTVTCKHPLKQLLFGYWCEFKWFPMSTSRKEAYSSPSDQQVPTFQFDLSHNFLFLVFVLTYALQFCSIVLFQNLKDNQLHLKMVACDTENTISVWVSGEYWMKEVFFFVSLIVFQYCIYIAFPNLLLQTWASWSLAAIFSNILGAHPRSRIINPLKRKPPT